MLVNSQQIPSLSEPDFPLGETSIPRWEEVPTWRGFPGAIRFSLCVNLEFMARVNHASQFARDGWCFLSQYLFISCFSLLEVFSFKQEVDVVSSLLVALSMGKWLFLDRFNYKWTSADFGCQTWMSRLPGLSEAQFPMWRLKLPVDPPCTTGHWQVLGIGRQHCAYSFWLWIGVKPAGQKFKSCGQHMICRAWRGLMPGIGKSRIRSEVPEPLGCFDLIWHEGGNKNLVGFTWLVHTFQNSPPSDSEFFRTHKRWPWLWISEPSLWLHTQIFLLSPNIPGPLAVLSTKDLCSDKRLWWLEISRGSKFCAVGGWYDPHLMCSVNSLNS